jgi:outer membrane receptor protein involved in Fe transport
VALADGATRAVVRGDGTTSRFVVRALPRFWGGELGARLRVGAVAELTAAAWASYLENETVLDGDHAAFVPSGPTRRLGVDVAARARLARGLWADVDLAQASATAADVGGAIALAPQLYVTGGLAYKRAGLRAGLRLRYLGPRPAVDESSPDWARYGDRRSPDYDPSRVVAEGWFLVDLYAAYRWRWLEGALGVQNLFDAHWRESQVANHSCTWDEAHDPGNPRYAGHALADGSALDRCGVAFGASRSGVADVHFTPGVPLQLQLTINAYF